MEKVSFYRVSTVASCRFVIIFVSLVSLSVLASLARTGGARAGGKRAGRRAGTRAGCTAGRRAGEVAGERTRGQGNGRDGGRRSRTIAFKNVMLHR